MVAYDLSASAGAPLEQPAPQASASHAPPVVVVMVTRNPGPWFEDALHGIAAQDYPNLSVLVIDAASDVDPLPLVARMLPAAYVRHLGGNPGFGAAANEVLGRVSGAAFFAFCHDDVVLEPEAISLLVEEAYRSDAGIVGPKLVAYGEPERLLQVGASADKTGVLAPLVERGELDQEQHDRVRDVFAIPGACTVVRAELFESLGGFDPDITFLGDDLDLCWRAQVVGARVVVVPAARAQHVEALSERLDDERPRRLLARHRLRTVLSCYGLFHLLRVLPQSLLLSVGQMVYGLATGRPEAVADIAGAWWWNIRHLGGLRRRRRHLRRNRRFADAEIRRLQARGSATISAFVRGEIGGGERVRSSIAEVGRGITGSFARPRRLVVGAWLAVAVVLLVGSRSLLFGPLPVVGAFAAIDEGPLDLVREYLSGWRSGGMGSEGPSPTAVGLFGLGGLATLGATGILQKLLVLAALPAGAFGMWRLTERLGVTRARVAGLVAYTVVPLPYDAMAEGRWGSLAFYALAPWILGALWDAVPEPPVGGDDPPAAPSALRSTVVLGVLVAGVAALVPAAIVVVPLVALAVVLGSAVCGAADLGMGALRRAALAAGVAIALHFPWSLDLFLPGSGFAGLVGVEPPHTEPLAIADLLRMQTGSGVELLAWGVPVAAALAVVVGREWRLAWAARLWFVALTCWVLVWAAGRGALPFPVPSATFLLVPAAVALAFAVALGLASLEVDVRADRFGFRQVTSMVAVAALGLAVLPTVGAALDGRWGMPSVDLADSLRVLRTPEVRGAGPFRVLWLGHPEVVPVGSHRIADGLSYGITRGSEPTVTELWPGRADGGTRLVAEAVRLVSEGETQRVGRLLAPLGVRYVAVPERIAPERAGTARHPVPPNLLRSFGVQLDLRRIAADPAVTLYENMAWAPVRAALTGDDAEAVLRANSLVGPATGLDLSDAAPALTEPTGRLRFEGELGEGALYVAAPSSPRWRLEVDGEPAGRTDALGWANGYAVERAGHGVLQYDTSPLRWIGVAVQVALWVAALGFLLRGWSVPVGRSAHRGEPAEPGPVPGRGL